MSNARGALLFKVQGLRAGFDGTTVLFVDDLRVEEGKVTVLVGENGSGKTTLLRLLNGLLEPSAGSIEFRGLSLAADGRAAVRAQSVMVHQSPLLFRGSVLQNVGYGPRVRGVGREETSRRAARALEQVGLAGFERRRASGLSGGEMQRVALARALALGAEVLLLDEPTANVDPDSRAVVERVVRDLSASGTSVLMSTHSMEIAYRLCDTLIRMEAGRIVPGSENILKGSVDRTDEQFTFFHVAGKDRPGPVLLCPARQGEFRVAVLPLDELILSREPLTSSARNQLRGFVTSTEPRDRLLVVTVDCGIALQALITPAAAAEIGVETGREIVVTFKASAVRLY